MPVKWCAKCEDHMSSSSWTSGKDVCDRCHAGENNAYLKRRKGSPDRVAAAIAAAQDPKNWLADNAVERFEKWCASAGYAKRFQSPKLFGMEIRTSEKIPDNVIGLVGSYQTEQIGEMRHDIVGIVNLGSEEGKSSSEPAKDGKGSPFDGLEDLV